MYSSVSEAEYQMKKARAEEEARNAYDRSGASRSSSVPSRNLTPGETKASHTLSQPISRGWLSGFLSRIQEDDILLIALLFLLFNDSKDDDPLILIVIAALLLN